LESRAYEKENKNKPMHQESVDQVLTDPTEIKNFLKVWSGNGKKKKKKD